MQDWTKQESEDAEGVVTFSYRTEREKTPDIQTIQKQMAIVAWQPGPNRVVQVPNQVRTECLVFLAQEMQSSHRVPLLVYTGICNILQGISILHLTAVG